MKYAEMTPENFVDLHSYCPIENSSEEFIPTAMVIKYLKSKEYARLKSQEENAELVEALKKSGDWVLIQENASLQIRIDERNNALKQLLDALPRPDAYNSKLIAAMENAHELTTPKG